MSKHNLQYLGQMRNKILLFVTSLNRNIELETFATKSTHASGVTWGSNGYIRVSK